MKTKKQIEIMIGRLQLTKQEDEEKLEKAIREMTTYDENQIVYIRRLRAQIKESEQQIRALEWAVGR